MLNSTAKYKSFIAINHKKFCDVDLLDWIDIIDEDNSTLLE